MKKIKDIEEKTLKAGQDLNFTTFLAAKSIIICEMLQKIMEISKVLSLPYTLGWVEYETRKALLADLYNTVVKA